MLAWLQYKGPLSEAALTPRPLKRVKDKEKKHLRQAMKAQDAQQSATHVVKQSAHGLVSLPVIHRIHGATHVSWVRLWKYVGG
eukprot:926574-Pelagomonas_calceolata.AAC.1